MTTRFSTKPTPERPSSREHLSPGGTPRPESIASTSALSDSSHPGARSRKRWPRAFSSLQHISLELENSGSVARDHLASERTWLAYVRTSLSIASAGVALVQLFAISAQADQDVIHRFARPLGAASVGVAIAVLLIGLWRYFDVQNALTRGKFSPARWTIILISAVMAVITASIFGFLLSTQ